MLRAGRGRALAWLAAVAVLAGLAGLAGPVRADDTEHRDYVIFVNGKEGGQSRITLQVKDDGTTQVTASARVKVQLFGVFNAYSYNVESRESWKDGRLVALNLSATENGKNTKVTAAVEGSELRVRVNGGTPYAVNRDAWPSSYWKLADARFHNKDVPVLDADTGKEYTGKLQYVATEELNVGGGLRKCYHFRITGIPQPIELWFDQYHRMVRQEFDESGQRTQVQLIRVWR